MLPSTGPLTFSAVRAEFGSGLTMFSQLRGASEGVPVTGTIAMSHLRGKSAQVSYGGSKITSSDTVSHTFTSSGSFVLRKTVTAELLVAGGGGGGGGRGGGGGGVLLLTPNIMEHRCRYPSGVERYVSSFVE